MPDMKIKEGSVKVLEGDSYSDKLIIGCTVEGTPKGAAEIKVEIERDKGRYSWEKKLVVALSGQFQHKKFREALGIRRMTDVNGLREAALECAQKHWEKFKPTAEQITSFRSGSFDGCVEVKIDQRGHGRSVEVVLSNLPYASEKLSGELALTLSEDLKNFTLNARNSQLRRAPRDKREEVDSWKTSRGRGWKGGPS